jgi:hypothetical protein
MPTSRPAWANAIAVALPMPESEAVTIAVRGVKSIDGSLSGWVLSPVVVPDGGRALQLVIGRTVSLAARKERADVGIPPEGE